MMDWSLKIIVLRLVFIGIILFHNVIATGVRVTIDQGTLEGKLMTTDSGFVYRAFYSIPYAKPPVGNLRFKDPVPPQKWQGILNATTASNVCAQFDRLFQRSFVGAEDCLYLNVYVPDSTKSCDLLPVMFWIHGGAFVFGNGNDIMYGPDPLVERNVIVVSVNYRLGPLGFLSLDNVDAPGNAGIKDQVLALKWVNRNIHRFGGDPDSITLFGESAGAAAVNFLILSPLANGLFSKVILQSGTSQNEWAIQYDNYTASAFNLGNALGVNASDKKTLIKGLLNIPVKDLVMASLSPTVEFDPLYPAFAPIIEKNIPSVSSLLSKDPHFAMQRISMCGVPVMIGSTANEGYLIILIKGGEALGAILSGNATLNQLVPNFKTYVPRHLRERFDNKTLELAAKKIKQVYFPTNDNIIDNFLNLVSDYSFVKDIHEAAKIFSKQTKTFYYKFSYKGSLNILKQFCPIPYKDSSHLDELGYLFNVHIDKLLSISPPTVSDKDKLTIRRMSKMWTDFAKYGNPTSSTCNSINTIWKPVSKNNLTCLSIGDDLKMIDDPYAQRMKIWEELETLQC